MKVDKDGYAIVRRNRAWQTLMIVAINHMIESGKEPVREGTYDKWDAFSMDLSFNGERVLAFFSDPGCNEVAVKVMLRPSETGYKIGHAAFISNHGLDRMGRAYASGWLARTSKGRWLQTSVKPQFYACRMALEEIDGWGRITPANYRPNGRFIL